MRSKICPYCYTIFLEVDFPHDFNGRVTCGSSSCMNKGKKRLESREETYSSPLKNDDFWDLNEQKGNIEK